MKRLAIVTTHPIQYNAPLFQQLALRKKTAIKVFYTWGEKVLKNKFDPGFGKTIEWDIPLLEGYDYCFVENTAAHPGSHHFKGIINPSLNSEIKKWHADAVLVYGWSFDSHLKCMRFFHNKIPVFFRGDSTLLDQQPALKDILRSIFLKWVYRYVDVALYAGTNSRNYFKKYGITDARLAFAPHAVDNNRFADDDFKQYEQKALEWRRQLSYRSTDIVFLFAGKLESKKDPLLLVNAFKKITNSNAHLLIAGNGHLENELKQAAAGHSRIQFIGFQNQSRMPILYRVGDCMVLPSKGPAETWGLAVNEAMASGRAAIVSDKCGCAADLIKDGITGYVFRSGDEKGLTLVLEKFAMNRGNALACGNAAAKLISNWNTIAICETIEKLMQ